MTVNQLSKGCAMTRRTAAMGTKYLKNQGITGILEGQVFGDPGRAEGVMWVISPNRDESPENTPPFTAGFTRLASRRALW